MKLMDIDTIKNLCTDETIEVTQHILLRFHNGAFHIQKLSKSYYQEKLLRNILMTTHILVA